MQLNGLPSNMSANLTQSSASTHSVPGSMFSTTSTSASLQGLLAPNSNSQLLQLQPANSYSSVTSCNTDVSNLYSSGNVVTSQMNHGNSTLAMYDNSADCIVNSQSGARSGINKSVSVTREINSDVGTFSTSAGTYSTIYQCQQCNIGYVNKQAYEVHMASHNHHGKSSASDGSCESNQPIMVCHFLTIL